MAREYHYIGEALLRRSSVKGSSALPKDDIVKWLFMQVDDRQYSFTYEITQPQDALYEQTFELKLSFLKIEAIIPIVRIGHTYKVYRGLEEIGAVQITKKL